MKKKFYLLWAVAVLIGCNDSIQEDIVPDVDAGSRYGVMSDGPHRVTLSDVTTLTKAQTNATRAAGVAVADSKVTCFVDAQQDTLLYICDKAGGGWTVYSSDTRVPAVVAQSSSGTYADAMQNEAARLWMEAIAEDMKHIRAAADSALNFTAEEISANREFWRSVSDADAYVREKLAAGGTRSFEPNPDLTPVGFPRGHYELASSKYYDEVYDSVPRMTKTLWYQREPCNMYCPQMSFTSMLNAPAGCVAIAGAQMLYFLHYKLSVPETAPSKAYCNGSVSTGYDWDQYDYTSEIWDEMDSAGTNSGPLIANVGKRVNMNYGDDGSGAYTRDLVNNVFAPYGISCTYGAYDTGKLTGALLQGIPVLLDAYSTTSGGKSGHAFIADRYKRVRHVTKRTYMWKFDYIPPLTLVAGQPDSIAYVYSSPQIDVIGMNWGWGYSDPGEWYTLTGDWIVESYNWKYNWNINRHMICDFSVIED